MAKKTTTTKKVDLYQEVTDKLVAELEKGVRPWMKPWDNSIEGVGVLPLRANGTPYKGMNVLLLWGTACAMGYDNPTWMTYKQASELKGQVRKGEKGTPIVFASTFSKEVEGVDKPQKIPFLRSYTVFNIAQIDGLPEKYHTPKMPVQKPVMERFDAYDKFIGNTFAHVKEGGNRAYYSPVTDHIQLPPIAAFKSPLGYAATGLHELTHWTKHPARLDRDYGKKNWGDEGYAMEELVAEIGSAFLCASIGLAPEVQENHAAYLKSWLRALKDDKKFIFSAASAAQKAADFLWEMQPGYVKPVEEKEAA